MEPATALRNLKEGYVSANAIISITVILFTHWIHYLLSKYNRDYYGRAPLIDKLTVLMNLDFALVYVIVLVPFSVGAARIILFDSNTELANYFMSVNFGFNTLAILFLFEGILVGSVRPNRLLFFHHLVFFIFVQLFVTTKSTLVMRVGLVLGCLTTWQIFPRVTATLRYLGVRRRRQKIVALMSVLVGFVTRIILGPIGLIKVSVDGFKELEPTFSSWATYVVTLGTIFLLLYMELEGVLRHIKLHQKLKKLAQESLINMGNAANRLMTSVLRRSQVQPRRPSTEKPALGHPEAVPEGKPLPEQSKRPERPLVILQRQGSKIMSSLTKSIAQTAMEGGEEYIKYIEETAFADESKTPAAMSAQESESQSTKQE